MDFFFFFFFFFLGVEEWIFHVYFYILIYRRKESFNFLFNHGN